MRPKNSYCQKERLAVTSEAKRFNLAKRLVDRDTVGIDRVGAFQRPETHPCQRRRSRFFCCRGFLRGPVHASSLRDPATARRATGADPKHRAFLRSNDLSSVFRPVRRDDAKLCRPIPSYSPVVETKPACWAEPIVGRISSSRHARTVRCCRPWDIARSARRIGTRRTWVPGHSDGGKSLLVMRAGQCLANGCSRHRNKPAPAANRRRKSSARSALCRRTLRAKSSQNKRLRRRTSVSSSTISVSMVSLSNRIRWYPTCLVALPLDRPRLFRTPGVFLGTTIDRPVGIGAMRLRENLFCPRDQVWS